jgi:hypothetical protein
MTARRRGRVALLGALGAAALSVPLALPAGADTSFDYSGKTGAIGIQVLLDSNPEFSSVADMFDVQVPSADATFDSYGTSDSSGHLANANGLATLPGLLCLAGIPCSDIGNGIGQQVPPADPLDAHAAYPSPKTADAPIVNGKTVQVSGGDPSSAQLALGVAHAEADLNHVSATVTGGRTTLIGQITVGSTSLSQVARVVGGALVTHAESTVKDIDIGTGLIHVGSVTAVSDVTSTPNGKPVDKSSVTISGVTAAGQAATIDQDGVHLSGQDGLTSALNGQLQQFVNNQLAAGGVTLRAIGVDATDDDTGHTSLAQGLFIGVKSTAQGLPAPNVGFPAGVPCPIPDFGLSICGGIGLNPNADYFGQILLGQAGTISLTQASGLGDVTLPSTPLPSGPIPTPGTTGGAPPSTPASSIGDNGGTTTFTPPTTSVGGGPVGPGPQVANPQQPGTTTTVGLSEELGHGLHGRLLWLFPVLLLAVVGAIAGRLRAPHRFPGPRR